MCIKESFITTNREFKEGTVEVFQQCITSRNVKIAKLEITALGVYEANIDGKKIGDMMFAPGFTYYPLHLNVQTYDVSDMLKSNSILQVYLGQGWYCGRFTHENKTQIYGDVPAVSWVLTILDEDGIEHVFKSTDKSVKSIQSPYEYAGLYDGEIYYGKDIDNNKLDEIIAPKKYKGQLPAEFKTTIDYPKLQEQVEIVKVTEYSDHTIIDFGQNFAGVIEINPNLMTSDAIHIRHGEILNTDGSLYTTNLRKAKAELTYYKGLDTEIYRPKFTYMGFRYIEISSCDYTPGLIKAFAVYNSMKKTGEFKSDNKLVNQLFNNQIWGQKSNYIEVPMDCPQRDERMGYTGDGHVFALTGSYNFDTEQFWDKFLTDIRYTQMDNSEGYVAPTVPANGPSGIGYLTMLGWGNCVTIVPEMLYWQYGTDKYLIEQYDSMKKFVECEIKQMGDNYLWMGINLGDWLMQGKDTTWMAQNNNPVSNAFIVNDLRILSWTAKKLGKDEDAKRYSEYLEKVRNKYIETFIDQDGFIKEDYQGAYLLALKFVVEKGDLWNKVFANLVRHVRDNGMQTGFFGTEHILPILTLGGEHKLAYDLLLSEECPGWMYQIKLGATTTWERWDAIKPDGTVNEIKLSDDNMVSFNHYAFGSVGRFYYQHILGITALEPGFKRVQIKPIIDSRLGKVQGEYKSRYGTIRVEWEIAGSDVLYTITSPVIGLFIADNDEKFDICPGTQKFKVKKGKNEKI